MATKTLGTILIVILCIFMMPVLLGILGGVFGLVAGAIGGAFGLVAGVFGAVFGGIFGVIGWLFEGIFGGGWGFGMNFFTIVCIILLVVVLSRQSKVKR